METNMTEGSPFAHIIKFTIPLLLGNIFQQIYNMTDSMIVGKYVGAGALAAVGSTGTIMFLVIGVSMGLATGFSVMTSQYFGAYQKRHGTASSSEVTFDTDADTLSDLKKIRTSVTNGILLSLLFSVIITAVSLFMMPSLLTLMNTPADIYYQALSYISIVCGGVTGIMLYNLFAAYLRAIGNSKAPLFFLVLSAGINIVLDLVLIIVFHMGVSGAALATAAAQGLSGIFCAVYIYVRVKLLRPTLQDWRIDPECMKHQLFIGIPMALETAITASGTLIMQSAINIYGTVAVAGSTAAYKLINLFTQGHYTINQTMAIYAGQNYGAGRVDRLREGTRAAMIMNVIYSIIMAVLGILIARPFISLFFDSSADMDDLIYWAMVAIVECGAAYVFLGMIFIYRSTLQGCGFSVLAMTMGIMELSARTAFSFISMQEHSYILAIASDSAAWVTAGIFGYFLFRIRIEGKVWGGRLLPSSK